MALETHTPGTLRSDADSELASLFRLEDTRCGGSTTPPISRGWRRRASMGPPFNPMFIGVNKPLTKPT